MVGHDYMKCPMSVTGEPVVRACEVDTTREVSHRGGLAESGGGDEKKRREGGSVNEPLEGGSTGEDGGMHRERLGIEEEKRYVGSRPETTRAGEDLLTVVKTNLPMLWAIGKRFVILALILLHFCGEAQALHLPMRGLPRRGRPPDSSSGAGGGVAAALGRVPPLQAAAPPLRVAENKHNCTSLLAGGEMLQQCAWTPQRAPLQIGKGQDSSLPTVGEIPYQRAWTAQRVPPQTGKGQDSSSLLRALGGTIMYTWMRRLYASVTPATPHCYRQADMTTETNRHARLRTCLPGRSRLHSISRHHTRQLGNFMRHASNRSGGGEETMPTSPRPRASASSTNKPTMTGPRQGDTGLKRKRSRSQRNAKPGKKHMGGPKS